MLILKSLTTTRSATIIAAMVIILESVSCLTASCQYDFEKIFKFALLLSSLCIKNSLLPRKMPKKRALNRLCSGMRALHRGDWKANLFVRRATPRPDGTRRARFYSVESILPHRVQNCNRDVEILSASFSILGLLFSL
jgi:hypothetical protein